MTYLQHSKTSIPRVTIQNAIFGDRNLTSFAEMILLMGKKKVAPIASWEEVVSQLEAWAMFCTLFLGDDGVHPVTYDMLLFQEETSGVSPRLQEQDRQKPTLPSALLRFIQQELNDSFRQALDRKQREVKTFKSLQRVLATRDFRPELVALPGRLTPLDSTQPPPAAPHCQELESHLPAAGTPPPPNHQTHGRRINQDAEQNYHPAPQIHIGPGFRIRMALDKAAASGVSIPLTDDGHHFCLLYHLKGVFNPHCGGLHLHRSLS